MGNRFEDIIAEDMGFPTTQELRYIKEEWDELEQSIYEIDNNWEYSSGVNFSLEDEDYPNYISISGTDLTQLQIDQQYIVSVVGMPFENEAISGIW